MQQVIDYNREVFNGDIGTIGDINLEEQELIIRFNERDVKYDIADLNEITLAFATTIHKAQGSEYPVVIMPIFTQHYLMLTRNLFYTGLTRAKKLAIIVGQSKANCSATLRERDGCETNDRSGTLYIFSKKNSEFS